MVDSGILGHKRFRQIMSLEKYFLVYFDSQKKGRNFSWIPTSSYIGQFGSAIELVALKAVRLKGFFRNLIISARRSKREKKNTSTNLAPQVAIGAQKVKNTTTSKIPSYPYFLYIDLVEITLLVENGQKMARVTPPTLALSKEVEKALR